MGLVNPALYWLLIGLMMFFLALAMPGFVLYIFALGALTTALAVWFFPVDIVWQLALFMSVSLLAVLGVKGRMGKNPNNPTQAAEEEVEDVPLVVIGEKGVVGRTIAPPAEGLVKCSGMFWRANADEKIEEGEIVSVVGQQGSIVHVEKV